MGSLNTPLHVGLFGIGLDTYWPQFPGLRDKLVGFTSQVARQLETCGVRVINLGLIDSPEKSLAAGHDFRKADVDLIFLHGHNLRAFLHRAASRAAGEGAGNHSQSLPRRRPSIIRRSIALATGRK